jgi:hypothetical protein
VTRDDFLAYLLRFGLSASMISFDGPGAGEQYGIEHRRDGWAVYYYERGERRDERMFSTESEALRYLLGWVVDQNL